MSFFQIKSIKINKNNNSSIIELDTGQKYVISIDLVVRNKLNKGTKIEKSLLEKILEEQRIIDAKNIALNLISYRARTSFQIEEKLQQKGYTKQEIQKVIQFLKEFSYLDDKSFVRNYINFALGQKKRSRAQIIQELYRKGISKEDAEEVFKEIEIENKELENAYFLGLKKYKQLSKQNKPNPINRLAQYLYTKGFAWDVIQKACDKIKTELNSNENTSTTG
ncbi:MAG: recombination regulator RecX [Ignavibacteria bacterium]|nr:recombination regulator RecX [Ignavibacteria bacterium]